MKGKLFVISSVAGGGKSTLINRFLAKHKNFHFAVSYTSRPPRQGDEEGKTYFFVSREEFEKLISENYFFEWALVHGNYYGTPKKEIQLVLEDGKNVILDIDIQGMEAVKKEIGGVVTLFILPPDEKTWLERLKGRGTENDDTLQKRISSGLKELRAADKFDLKMVNSDLEEASREFEKLILENSGYRTTVTEQGA